MRKEGRIPTYNITIDKYICDKCKKEATPMDVMEYQEYITIKISPGFGSALGDAAGNVLECDLCSECQKDLFGDYMRWQKE